MRKLVYYFLLTSSVLFIMCAPASKQEGENQSTATAESSGDRNFIIYNSVKENWNSVDSIERDSLYSFILDKYFMEMEGINYKSRTSRALGNPINYNTASGATDRYCDVINTDPTNATRSHATKSVYFTASEIVQFVDQLDSHCTGTKGVRMYFAKHGSHSNAGLVNQNFVILRGVCDYEDMSHTLDGTPNGFHVAYDFGDACPPLCTLNGPPHKGGEYAANGFQSDPK